MLLKTNQLAGHVETQAIITHRTDALAAEMEALRRQGEEAKALLMALMAQNAAIPPSVSSISVWLVDPFGIKHQFIQVPSSPEVSPSEVS